jgi:hypothetical protein
MLSPNLILSETGQRVVIDGGVDLGLLPTAMAAGVPRARAMEGGEGGAESLQEDDVVLMMPLVGVEGSYTGRSAEGREAAEERGSSALWSGQFWWKNLKLACSMSFGGSWKCCSCFGSEMGSSGGG